MHTGREKRHIRRNFRTILGFEEPPVPERKTNDTCQKEEKEKEGK